MSSQLGMETLYGHGNASAAADAAAAVAATSGSYLQSPRIAIPVTFLILFLIAKLSSNNGTKLPDGAKPLPRLPGLPWAGRFWDVPGPGLDAAFHFGALHKRFGPIYEWKVMGTLHIWLETDKVARDLFVSRQRKYCDRNDLPGAQGVKPDGEILPLAAYSETFKRSKNFIHTIMRHSHPKQFYGWPMEENKKTLRRLLESPDRWSEHMIVHCARTIASIAWADPNHGNKLLIVVPDLLKVVSPDGPIVNKLTFLKNVPAAISPWKKYEAKRKQKMTDAFYEALTDVKQRLENGEDMDCWSKLWLEKEKAIDACKLDWHEAAYAIGSASFVAIATIGGPLHAFFTACAHYPSWLPKLQEEIDTVCGGRMPAVEDLPQMPRLRATVKEMLRWRQSTPLGVPHEAMEDDVYNGYFIPKGAMLHANHYLISREPSKFPRGNDFVPERWLDPSYPTYKEPLTEFPNIRGDTAFGYGSRACPGVDLTSMELCTLFGALAWAFDITPKEGQQVNPWYEVNPYVITMGKPFPIDIKPRSEERARQIVDQCPDPGYVLKDAKDGAWDLLKAEPGKFWDWEGLAPFHAQDSIPKVYPADA